MNSTSLALSAATARVPAYQPHSLPATNEAPDVATVGDPELQAAATCLPGRPWSVIGTDSL